MAKCLEFMGLVTKTGMTDAVTTPNGGFGQASGTPSQMQKFRSYKDIYACPSNSIAKIITASNLGISLLYTVYSPGSNTGVVNPDYGIHVAAPSRHRSMDGVWLKGGDQLRVYDFYDLFKEDPTAVYHPSGFYAVIAVYKMKTGCWGLPGSTLSYDFINV